MNAELAEPVLSAVASQWQQLFGTDMSKQLAETQLALAKVVEGFDARFLELLAQRDGAGGASSAGCAGGGGDGGSRAGEGSCSDKGGASDACMGAGAGGAGTAQRRATPMPPRTAGVDRSSAMRTVAVQMRAAGEQLKADLNKQQQEISRTVEPAVQTGMTPGYDAGVAEAGTGSHMRRMAIIDLQVRTVAASEFQAAAKALVGKLVKLQARLLDALVKDSCEAIVTGLRVRRSHTRPCGDF